MAQQSHEELQPELQDDYVEKEMLKGAGVSAGVGVVAGGATGVVIGAEAGAFLAVGTGAVVSAPVIIPALIGAGVVGAIGSGIAYLVAKSDKKDALDRKQKKKCENTLTERKHQKSALRKAKQRPFLVSAKKDEAGTNNVKSIITTRPDSIVAMERKEEEKNKTKEVAEKQQRKIDAEKKKKKNKGKPTVTTTTTTPTTVSNTQPCKLNSSSCTTKMADTGRKIISKALIVLISIEEYFGEKENRNKLTDLTSARMDTQHIIELYADKYGYNIITNKHKYCKLEELKNLLREAQGEFSKGDYQCIFVIFSGHGTKDKLMLRDYHDVNGNKDVGIYYKYNTMDRTELECYFNGDNVTNKADKLKVYIMDACRGSDDALPVMNDEDDRKYRGIEQRGNQQNRKGLHANENRIIFYPNTEPYAAYGYKESGGILINGLYQTMTDDANMDKNLDEIGDIIKDKVEADLVPVLGNNGKIIGEFTVKIEIKTTMKSRNMREIYFVKSEDKNKERIKTLNELNKNLNLLYV